VRQYLTGLAIPSEALSALAAALRAVGWPPCCAGRVSSTLPRGTGARRPGIKLI